MARAGAFPGRVRLPPPWSQRCHHRAGSTLLPSAYPDVSRGTGMGNAAPAPQETSQCERGTASSRRRPRPHIASRCPIGVPHACSWAEARGRLRPCPPAASVGATAAHSGRWTRLRTRLASYPQQSSTRGPRLGWGEGRQRLFQGTERSSLCVRWHCSLTFRHGTHAHLRSGKRDQM